MARARVSVPLIHFLGGTGTVTGSRFLVDGHRARVLVDCGLYQGPKALRERNWAPFPVEPESVDAVLLTHAHVDHSGYLPALYRSGFRGKVFATRGTIDLCRIVLLDCAHLQEEEAGFANRMGYSKHDPALPLFTIQDAEAALHHFEVAPFDQRVEVAEDVSAIFRRSGHILGSASIALTVEGREPVRILFSGDMGRPEHPILLPPEPPSVCDALLVESTYGDRDHRDADAVERLVDVVCRTTDRGGVVLIPAFAVDRTEVVLLHLHRLINAGEIPAVDIYVDSPMALAALAVYRRAIDEGWEEVRPELRGRAEILEPSGLVEARSVDDSKAIHGVSEGAVIISASGMATGGRILHHLERRLPNPRNSVALVGFQAVETRGRRLLSGARQVKMHGHYVPVRCEISDVSALSVHADRGEIIAWLRSAKEEPDSVFVVHGEPSPAAALREQIEAELGWNAIVPAHLERVQVTASWRSAY
ncbi:MAG: MBL fold metallo-hydrolase [Deltaproteobacteria bacterium]|nr:MBL fold metallo-hydrolase [Deltaproteobacteria bacterium]MBW2418407.1 MBL fold metallo-hydrolase [Deltaproteobacteria bacterium]